MPKKPSKRRSTRILEPYIWVDHPQGSSPRSAEPKDLDELLGSGWSHGWVQVAPGAGGACDVVHGCDVKF